MDSASTTVLLIGHGSRKPASNDAVREFMSLLQTRFPNYRMRLCFIEFADVLLDEGLEQAANESTHVIIVPLMLGAAGHVNSEIPKHVNAAKKRHQHVRFVISKHLGAGLEVLQALLQQMNRATPHIEKPSPTSAILLARGSSDMVANGEPAKMAHWVFESSQCAMVDAAFSGLTTPTLETVVKRQILCGMQRIIILPYYLFTGVLITRIARQVQQLRLHYSTTVFDLADPIAFSDSIYTLVHQRILEYSLLELPG
ncbi:MAG: sirohydrochlorin chelatase [Mariprofundaceae bacterium]|nr:sirohydrochlorin chelatase [Mariprofundaceae bacterium]